MRGLAATITVALLTLAPRLADACPACAKGSGGIARGVLIGSMIAAPFVAVGIAIPLIGRMIRRADAIDVEPADPKEHP